MGQTRASRRPRTRPSAPPRHKARPPTKRKMKSTALAVALAVATVSTCLAEKEETYLEAATHFCGKSEPDSDHPQVLLTHFTAPQHAETLTTNNKQCGWVGMDDPRYKNDREGTIDQIGCPQCGTVGGGWYQENEAGTGGSVRYPPNAIIGPGINGAGYSQYFPRYFSLGCRGKKVEVQAVYKLIDAGEEQNGSGPYYAGLSLTDDSWYPQNLTRCSLGSGPEASNTLSDCRECQQSASGEGGCPIEKDAWYEDTMILDMPEQCPPSQDGPVMPSIFVNSYQTLNVSAYTATPIT